MRATYSSLRSHTTVAKVTGERETSVTVSLCEIADEMQFHIDMRGGRAGSIR